MSSILSSKKTLISAATILVAVSFGAYVYHKENRPPALELYVFALKSGQAAFIRTPEDKRILVDGGGNSDVIREISKILPFYSRRIDALIATNDEAKNVGGLIDIINRYDVAKAYLPSVTLESLNIASATDQVYSTFLDSLATKNIQKTMISDGDSLDFGIKVKAKAFFPVSANDFAYSKASFPEMAIQIALGSTSVTFIGDASKKVQKYIAASSSLVFSYSVPVSFESASSPDSIVSAVVSVEANHLEAGASLTNDSNDSNQSGPSSATSSSLLIVSTSASPDQMSAELVNLLKPNYLIYSKSASRDFSKPKNLALTAPSASSTLKSSKTKASMKMPVDPLESVPIENRFNLKEKGEIHIISDGRHIVIE